MDIIKANTIFTAAIKDVVGTVPDISVAAKAVGKTTTLYTITVHGGWWKNPILRLKAIAAMKEVADSINAKVDWR